jgi:hypothetical protein
MGRIATRGYIPEIVHNKDDLYEGDLCHYFRVVFTEAKNLFNPYHNPRHSLHIFFLFYQACIFYQDLMTRREMREGLIAALMHDFNHTGRIGNDHRNIVRAWQGLHRHILDDDRRSLPKIQELIGDTEYPHVIPSADLDLGAQILRDADLAQGLSDAWIQQVIFGLAAEQRKTPIEVLASQVDFLTNLRFHTDWAREMFPRSAIDAKIEEVQDLLSILR